MLSYRFSLDQKGITLLEIVVVLALLFLIGGAVVEVFISSLKSTNIIFDSLSAQGEGRRTLQDFVNETRSANFSSIGSYPLSRASSTEIVFFTNLDGDSYMERVRYFLHNKQLVKGIIKPSGSPLQYLPQNETTSTVANYVVNTTTPVFYFYDQNYSGPTTTPLSQPVNITDVRVVSMNLIIDKNPILSPNTLNLRVYSDIRVLKTN